MRSYRIVPSINPRDRGSKTACIAKHDDGHAFLASAASDVNDNIAAAKEGLVSLSRMASRGKAMRSSR